jgi:hypothetical protein
VGAVCCTGQRGSAQHPSPRTLVDPDREQSRPRSNAPTVRRGLVSNGSLRQHAAGRSSALLLRAAQLPHGGPHRAGLLEDAAHGMGDVPDRRWESSTGDPASRPPPIANSVDVPAGHTSVTRMPSPRSSRSSDPPRPTCRVKVVEAVRSCAAQALRGRQRRRSPATAPAASVRLMIGLVVFSPVDDRSAGFATCSALYEGDHSPADLWSLAARVAAEESVQGHGAATIGRPWFERVRDRLRRDSSPSSFAIPSLSTSAVRGSGASASWGGAEGVSP